MAGSANVLLDQAGAALRDGIPEVPGQSKTVRTDLLEPNPWNINEMDAETRLRERNSIRRFGFVVPIIVRPLGKRFQIIDGQHRWEIATELGIESVPIHDIGPISDFEAEQLTIILNELRGKPNEKKLAASLKRLLAADTLDNLTAVLPYTKEVYGKLAGLPEFDFGKLQSANGQRARERSERRWVERVFRLAPDDAEKLAEALEAAKQDGDMSDGEALGAIAADWLGGR